MAKLSGYPANSYINGPLPTTGGTVTVSTTGGDTYYGTYNPVTNTVY